MKFWIICNCEKSDYVLWLYFYILRLVFIVGMASSIAYLYKITPTIKHRLAKWDRDLFKVTVGNGKVILGSAHFSWYFYVVIQNPCNLKKFSCISQKNTVT